jgi:hypothetical protein
MLRLHSSWPLVAACAVKVHCLATIGCPLQKGPPNPDHRHRVLPARNGQTERRMQLPSSVFMMRTVPKIREPPPAISVRSVVLRVRPVLRLLDI